MTTNTSNDRAKKAGKSEKKSDKSALFSGGGGDKAGGGPGGKQAGKSGGAGGKQGPKKPKNVAAVRAGKDRNWGPIIMFTLVGVLAAGLIAYAFISQRVSGNVEWRDEVAAIEGVTDFYSQNEDIVGDDYRSHVEGTVDYETSPPAYGAHNDIWQNCQGDIYTDPIPNEHAIHSLEHGAVWVTYQPDLPQSDVDTLASMVEGTEKMFMSPYPGLEAPISLQAWGYQLQLADPNDSRLNDFVRAARVNASLEGPTAACSNGVNVTGSQPVNVSGGM